MQRQMGAGNGRRARAAIGLNHIAINRDLTFAQRFEVCNGAGHDQPAAGFPVCARTACRVPPRPPRVWVERGSIPYSTVTQPLPVLRRNGGMRSSMEAVTNTYRRT